MTRKVCTVALIALMAGCSTTARHASVSNPAKPVETAAAPPMWIVRQPRAVTLPTPPPGGLTVGAHGAVVTAYQRRLRELHFDPGPVDGTYSQDTAYAVVAVEKLLGVTRDGVIGPAVMQGLEHFRYQPGNATDEENRVEINLDTQVLTVYQQWQPILITTTSTGSGEYFCGGSDGCQYAITPTGHFHFQYLHKGWDNGKLGMMWNPYYFNGGIAVHGLESVPSYPASHGCARIPMDIASYFPTLVTVGESVYVTGTAMKAGDRYVGPIPSSTTTTTTTTPAPTTTPKPSTTTTSTRTGSH